MYNSQSLKVEVKRCCIVANLLTLLLIAVVAGNLETAHSTVLPMIGRIHIYILLPLTTLPPLPSHAPFCSVGSQSLNATCPSSSREVDTGSIVKIMDWWKIRFLLNCKTNPKCVHKTLLRPSCTLHNGWVIGSGAGESWHGCPLSTVFWWRGDTALAGRGHQHHHLGG